MELMQFKLLFGLTAADLWGSLNLVMLTWLLMACFPRWKWTPTLTLVTPIFHSFIYAGSILSIILFPADDASGSMDFGSLEGVVATSQDPNTVFAGWVHYIAFDALVGRMMLLDSLKRGASIKFHVLVMIPCLFFTLMLGPVGFLSYMGLRSVFLPSKDLATIGYDVL
mmetsp:Transcript_32423/g.78746  ORF Transcript_32423/g.78746 Transcript_32423/m.78746 type:complete len:168 (+) Transcript_32423:108-611(+)